MSKSSSVLKALLAPVGLCFRLSLGTLNPEGRCGAGAPVFFTGHSASPSEMQPAALRSEHSLVDTRTLLCITQPIGEMTILTHAHSLSNKTQSLSKYKDRKLQAAILAQVAGHSGFPVFLRAWKTQNVGTELQHGGAALI